RLLQGQVFDKQIKDNGRCILAKRNARFPSNNRWEDQRQTLFARLSSDDPNIGRLTLRFGLVFCETYYREERGLPLSAKRLQARPSFSVQINLSDSSKDTSV